MFHVDQLVAHERGVVADLFNVEVSQNRVHRQTQVPSAVNQSTVRTNFATVNAVPYQKRFQIFGGCPPQASVLGLENPRGGVVWSAKSDVKHQVSR